jgi:hypothetical protein
MLLTPTTDPPHPVRRRSRWRVAVVVLVAGLLGGLLGAPYLIRLEAGGPPRFSPGAAVTVPAYGSHILAYSYGAEFTVDVRLVNRGILPLTITRIRLTDEPRPLVETTSVHVDGQRLPMTLWPGESADVALRARFANCRYYHERELQTMPGALVDGHLLGRPVTQIAAFDHDLVVHSPMIVGCPNRTLARDDDIRNR